MSSHDEPLITVLSVNIGRAQKVSAQGGRSFLTAHGKLSTSQRVKVQTLGLEGDEQADLTVHGGRSKAVYAYPHEHYAFWQTVRSQARLQLWDEVPEPGLLGENLSLRGLLEGQAWIGDRLKFADCVLAISEPRMPCGKFDAVMGFKQASRMMVQSGFCGFYLSVTEPGSIGAGDVAQVIPGPRQVNIAEVFRSRAGRQHLR